MSIRFTVSDRHGNIIYLTHERWAHISEEINHPEMADYEGCLKETIQFGKRKQDTLNPQKYRYSKTFDNLTAGNTHIIAIVLFRFSTDNLGQPVTNNYIVTAYQKEIG